ncbi:MAG: 50S ribosomal protein L15 [Truepera sp.]|nr:50S ribosomal protein L15 [Truepera sp.]
MRLNELKPPPGSKKKRRRLARGRGSGRGGTAGRGHKGQKSRSGFSAGAGWEGGRSRLIMRLPKRGFSRAKEPVQIVNLRDLNRLEAGATVTPESLVAAGLVRKAERAIKILGDGELLVKGLVVRIGAISKGAAAAITATGGRVSGVVDEEQT